MREYIGDWRDDVTQENAPQLFTHRDPRDRTSVYMPFVAQCFADTHVYRSYLEARSVGVGHPDYRSEKLADLVDDYRTPYVSDIRDRSQWLASQLPEVEEKGDQEQQKEQRSIFDTMTFSLFRKKK